MFLTLIQIIKFIMRKKFYFLSASIILISNIFFLMPESVHAGPESKIIGGVKGTQWGNPTCHCPDDAQSCFCFTSD